MRSLMDNLCGFLFKKFKGLTGSSTATVEIGPSAALNSYCQLIIFNMQLATILAS